MTARRVSTRAEVRWFAGRMEEKLRANDHKGHWSRVEDGYLLRRLAQEVGELRRAMARRAPSEEIIDEAADVANFAMMLADAAKRTNRTQPARARKKR